MLSNIFSGTRKRSWLPPFATLEASIATSTHRHNKLCTDHSALRIVPSSIADVSCKLFLVLQLPLPQHCYCNFGKKFIHWRGLHFGILGWIVFRKFRDFQFVGQFFGGNFLISLPILWGSSRRLPGAWACGPEPLKSRRVTLSNLNLYSEHSINEFCKYVLVLRNMLLNFDLCFVCKLFHMLIPFLTLS